MTQEQEPRGEEWIIREKISTRAVEGLMSNYRDPQQAFLELIDNAVDNRIEGRPLLVRIRISKNELSIYNQGGQGLTREGLEDFFDWGHPTKTTGKTIGFYGVGGKAAMGYLGRSMEVVCSPMGSQEQYKVLDPNWESHPENELKEFQPEVSKASSEDGYFRVRISNLKREVSGPALMAKLSDIYRPLLLEGSVKILVNNHQVEPLQIKYLADNPNLIAQSLRVQTRVGDWVVIKVGVLEEGQRIKPGVRCYYNGRLIEDEQFFGHPTPTQLPQMSRLIGEAYLDSVPVTTNKNNFDRGSVQYNMVAQRLNIVLAPWVEKLAKMRFEQTSPIESYEKDLARQAKRELEHILAMSDQITKAMLPGESTGRLPGTPTGLPSRPRGGGKGPGPQEGQTAPRLDAIIGEMKRWGALFVWEIASLGSSGKQVDVITENGKYILKINSDYPVYQAQKKADDAALQTYIGLTAIDKICETVSKGNFERYLDLRDSYSRDYGTLRQTKIKEPGSTRGRGVSRGTLRFGTSK